MRRADARARATLRLGGTRGLELPELEVTRPTLEDVYLQLTEAEDDATG